MYLPKLTEYDPFCINKEYLKEEVERIKEKFEKNEDGYDIKDMKLYHEIIKNLQKSF